MIATCKRAVSFDESGTSLGRDAWRVVRQNSPFEPTRRVEGTYRLSDLLNRNCVVPQPQPVVPEQ